MSEILINDLFEELIDENNRLLNDLTLSQRCLHLMEDYRKCLIQLKDSCLCDQSLPLKTRITELEEEYNRFNEDITKNEITIEDSVRRSTQMRSQFGIRSTRKRKAIDLSDNQMIRRKSLRHKSFEDVEEVAKSGSESDGNIDHKSDVKTNLKFLSKSDCLLEENGLIVTKMDAKNELILVVQQNDSSDQIFGFRCNWSDCQYVSVSKGKVVDHLRSVHSRSGLFVCRKCSQKFVSQKLLSTHTSEEHSNQFQCSYPDCTYTARTRQHLNDHLRRHEGVKPYPCLQENCDKRFTTRQELRRHNNLVHLGQRYVCDWPGCDEEFKNTKALEVHRGSHY